MPIEPFVYMANPKTDEDERSLSMVRQAESQAWAPEAKLNLVGAGAERVDAVGKVTGQAQYSSDVRLPGMLVAGVLRSPHAHARVVSLDRSRALAVPGVVDVIGSDDATINGEQIVWYDEKTPLFSPVLRFQGDELAAVAATSRSALAKALRSIDVDYEILPHACSMSAAMADDAPGIHPGGNHAGEPSQYSRGDVDAAFEQARRNDAAIVTADFETQVALHQPLEAHATTAVWHGDQLTVYESTQGIYAVRDQLAEVFKIPQGNVRVICDVVGGGFGAKQVAWKQTVFAALLARRTGRPVQLVLDRRGECLAAGNRNATRQSVRLAASDNGQIIAIDATSFNQGGAYTVGGESSNVGGLFQHLYQCENVRTRQQRIYTNTGPAVAFRAPGYVEGCFALECAIDELAERLEIDPMELRLRNIADHDQTSGKPWSSPKALATCLQRVDEAFGWKNRAARRAESTGDWNRGFGLAAHEWLAGSGNPPAYAWVKLNQDGSAEVIAGTQDIGTGTRTVLAQTAAEELSLDLDRVSVRVGDTGTGPYGPTSAGSFTVPTMVPAVRSAAADARRQLLVAAAALLNSRVVNLDVRNDVIVDRSSPEKSITMSKLLKALPGHVIQGHGARQNNPDDVSIRPFGAQCAEVEVNLRSGEIRLLRIVSAPDCGRVMNVKLADNQVIGGVTQGIGFAMTEARIVDSVLGKVLNANLEDYLVPTFADAPVIDHALVNLPDLNANPAGAKGLGELPMIPCAPAIVNAISDALGTRFRSLPVTRSAVLEAVRSQNHIKEPA